MVIHRRRHAPLESCCDHGGMDLGNTAMPVDVIAGIVIALGVLGVVIPVLPGLLLAWLGVLLWAVLGGGGAGTRWGVLAVATVVAIVGAVIKYLMPGKRLKR